MEIHEYINLTCVLEEDINKIKIWEKHLQTF